MPGLSHLQEVDSNVWGEAFPIHGYYWWQRQKRNIRRAIEYHDKKTWKKQEAVASKTVAFFMPFENLRRRHQPLNEVKVFDPKIAKLRRLKVTLQEVKRGAYKHVCHVKGKPPKYFEQMYENRLFDVLLHRLVQYMEAEERLQEFVDEATREAIRQRELQAQGILDAPPSIGAFDQIKHDVEEGRLKKNIRDISAQLGEIYGGFLLGMRMDQRAHHMQKGKTFFSNKRVDMNLFEFLYVFLTQFMWLLYDCVDSKMAMIRRRVTQVFRSEFFNWGGRKIHSMETYGDVPEGVVQRLPADEWVAPQRELEEVWDTRPRKKILTVKSTAVDNYANKLELKTKDEILRLDIFADDAPPMPAAKSDLSREEPSKHLLRGLKEPLGEVGILGQPLFSFDPATMMRQKKKTKSPEKFLYSYLPPVEGEAEPEAETASLDEEGEERGEDEEQHGEKEEKEEEAKIEERKSSESSTGFSVHTLEHDFIGNEELSRKNIAELEERIDKYHASVRETRAALVPGANMETNLTKRGFLLPIFPDEVVTKEVESDEDEAEEITPPKYAEVVGDPVVVDMTDGRRFALWKRKEWQEPKRCPLTGKIIDD